MDVKVTGSSPVYHPNANEKSDSEETTKSGKGRRERVGVKGEPAEEGGSTASIHKKTKETKLSVAKSGKSAVNKWEGGRGIHNGGRA